MDLDPNTFRMTRDRRRDRPVALSSALLQGTQQTQQNIQSRYGRISITAPSPAARKPPRLANAFSSSHCNTSINSSRVRGSSSTLRAAERVEIETDLDFARPLAAVVWVDGDG